MELTSQKEPTDLEAMYTACLGLSPLGQSLHWSLPSPGWLYQKHRRHHGPWPRSPHPAQGTKHPSPLTYICGYCFSWLLGPQRLITCPQLSLSAFKLWERASQKERTRSLSFLYSCLARLLELGLGGPQNPLHPILWPALLPLGLWGLRP